MMFSRKMVVSIVSNLGVILCIVGLLSPFYKVSGEGLVEYGPPLYTIWEEESLAMITILITYVGLLLGILVILIKRFHFIMRFFSATFCSVLLIVLITLFLRIHELPIGRLFEPAYGFYIYGIGIVLLWFSVIISRIIS
jgi:preprotein translocase subunit Sec61beta